jgi:hypothetical protein
MHYFTKTGSGGKTQKRAVFCRQPCNASNNRMNAETAQLLVMDHGKPLGLAEPVGGEPHVFQRRYERATVTLDCATFTGRFVPALAGE